MVLISSLSNANTIDDIKEKGVLKCGVYRDIPGYSLNNEGIEIELCSAVSYAIFGKQDNFEAIGLDADLRFEAVKAGELDISFASPVLNQKRDLTKGVDFVAPYTYELQGLLAMKSFYNKATLKLEDFSYKSFKDIKEEISVCVAGDTIIESSFLKYMVKHAKGKVRIKPYYSFLGAKRAFLRKECSLLSDQIGVLKSMLKMNEYFEPSILLDDIIEVLPLYAMIKLGDNDFHYLIKNIINGLLLAEDKDINSKNIDEVLNNTKDKEILYMFGQIKGYGKSLGVNDDFLYKIVKNLGNYGEIFDKHLGEASGHNASRGLNNLYKNGGLFYPFKVYGQEE